jgi:hypothetical protein
MPQKGSRKFRVLLGCIDVLAASCLYFYRKHEQPSEAEMTSVAIGTLPPLSGSSPCSAMQLKFVW